MKTPLLRILTSLLVLYCVGCSNSENMFGVAQLKQTPIDVDAVPAQDVSQVVFIVDDSSSMATAQSAMAEGIANMLQGLESRIGIDFYVYGSSVRNRSSYSPCDAGPS